MKQRVRKLAITLAALALIISVGLTFKQYLEQRRAAETYTQAQELAGLPVVETEDIPEDPVPAAPLPEGDFEPLPSLLPMPEREREERDPHVDTLLAMDLSALTDVNHQVLGWILIPDSTLSYPLLQGTDNQKYLNTTWQGERNAFGSIFLECKNSPDLDDFNTIVYGHRTTKGTMFGSLQDYEDLSYRNSHPHVYILHEDGCYVYAVYAAYEAGVRQQTYRIGNWTEKARQDFIDFSLERSVIDTGIVPDIDDHILTLSTCTAIGGKETRWVVQAVRIAHYRG